MKVLIVEMKEEIAEMQRLKADIASSGVGKESEENEKVKKEQVKRIRRQECQVIGTLAGGLSFQNKGWNL